MSVYVASKGIENFQAFLESLPEITKTSARIALNDTAKDFLARDIPQSLQSLVRFPAGYLADPTRLGVDRPASNDSLETTIFARERPTSLARFSDGATFGRGSNITVEVTPGRRIPLKKAFLVRLRSGEELTEDNFNIGLAIRVKPDQQILGRRQDKIGTVEIFPNVWLLYGPSVAQVFSDVAETIEPKISDAIVSEFFRQFERLSES